MCTPCFCKFCYEMIISFHFKHRTWVVEFKLRIICRHALLWHHNQDNTQLITIKIWHSSSQSRSDTAHHNQDLTQLIKNRSIEPIAWRRQQPKFNYIGNIMNEDSLWNKFTPSTDKVIHTTNNLRGVLFDVIACNAASYICRQKPSFYSAAFRAIADPTLQRRPSCRRRAIYPTI